MYQFPPDPETRASGTPSSGRWGVVVVVIGAVMVLVAAGVLALRTTGSGPDSASAVGDSSTTLRLAAEVDLDHPFRNTPAEGWPEGEAGIVAPPATAIGRYSVAQVAAALGVAGQLISASRLDRYVLETHDVEPVLALFAPHQAAEFRDQLRAGDDGIAHWLSIRISPDYTLLPVAPRVTGSMTPVLADDGELIIRTDYLVAYAFDAREPSRLDGPLDIVAVTRWEIDYRWIDDPAYDAGSQGVYLGAVDGHHYSVSCRHGDQGLLAPNYLNPPRFGGPAGDERDPDDYFDPTEPMPTEDGC